ncbi:hypothetical protein BDV39DRAFT_202646 [Aspergillus sergii]|uniref:CFEM domain-containing protein n=1 Tax=Aspergillus sergii TaxID=1034303 RepID=A0A5N6XDX2_9EURO|nr:hypothetical protein BDV39DRAFT_202646 [Aspergillus sergii]
MKFFVVAISFAALFSAAAAERKAPKCFDDCFDKAQLCTRESGPECFCNNEEFGNRIRLCIWRECPELIPQAIYQDTVLCDD